MRFVKKVQKLKTSKNPGKYAEKQDENRVPEKKIKLKEQNSNGLNNLI